MPPAFSSPRQGAAFAALLALLLALPALVAHTGWLDRRDVYAAIPVKYAPSTWLERQIFGETSDVDIAIVSSSHTWNDIDTPYLQRKLTEQLGRPAVVFTFGWPWPGMDALYTISRDLLMHRRVKMMVVYDGGDADEPHLHSSRWFRIGENSEALTGLPAFLQLRLYGGAVLGMPRQLLSVARRNPPEDPWKMRGTFWETYYHAPNIAERLGSLRARLAYNVSPNFHPFQPHGSATPADVQIYSESNRGAFAFAGRPPKVYQLHFARKLAQLCAERGTRLVVFKMPLLVEKGPRVPMEYPEWNPANLREPAVIAGIPPDKLFAGVSDEERLKLYYDDAHFNENGQDFFTPLITPALLHLYELSREP